MVRAGCLLEMEPFQLQKARTEMGRFSKATATIGIGVAAFIVFAIAAVAFLLATDGGGTSADKTSLSAADTAPATSAPSTDCPSPNHWILTSSRDQIVLGIPSGQGLPIRRERIRSYVCDDDLIGASGRTEERVQVFWRRMWPEDFREPALRRGWTPSQFDRCAAEIFSGRPDDSALGYEGQACRLMEHSLIYEGGTGDVPLAIRAGDSYLYRPPQR